MKNLMKGNYIMYKDNYAGSGYGWNNSIIKNTTMPLILESMPTDLRKCIKEVNTYAKEESGRLESVGILSKDKIFIPGCTEVFGRNIGGLQYYSETNQLQFPIFTNTDYMCKCVGSSERHNWWTRSRVEGNYEFAIVEYDGNYKTRYMCNGSLLCLCFNV